LVPSQTQSCGTAVGDCGIGMTLLGISTSCQRTRRALM
jgi:hypothetical protein